MIAGGSVRSFCHHRLVLLEQKFNLHVMLNADKEFLAQKTVCACMLCQKSGPSHSTHCKTMRLCARQCACAHGNAPVRTAMRLCAPHSYLHTQQCACAHGTT